MKSNERKKNVQGLKFVVKGYESRYKPNADPCTGNVNAHSSEYHKSKLTLGSASLTVYTGS